MKKLISFMAVFFILISATCFLSCNTESNDTSSNESNSETQTSNTPNDNDDGKNGTNKNDVNNILWFNDENNSFESDVTWQASNDLEKSMLLYEPRMELLIVDSKGNFRSSVDLKTTVDTRNYLIHGTLSEELESSRIFKWLYVPDNKLEARLYFSTGTELTVAVQDNIPDIKIERGEYSLKDFIISSGQATPWGTQFFGVRSMNNPLKLDGSWYKFSEYPKVKVSKCELTFLGDTYTALVDWTDSKLIEEYKNKFAIGYAPDTYDNGPNWIPEFTHVFKPGFYCYKSYGKYYFVKFNYTSCEWDKPYFRFSDVSEVSSEEIADSKTSVTIKITTLDGDVFSVMSNVEELAEIDNHPMYQVSFKQ